MILQLAHRSPMNTGVPRMEGRKLERFQVALPLLIERVGRELVAFSGWTMNVSSGGVLFTSDYELVPETTIEFVITLPSDGLETVSLRCCGTVLRVEPSSREAVYEVAATIDRYKFERGAPPSPARTLRSILARVLRIFVIHDLQRRRARASSTAALPSPVASRQHCRLGRELASWSKILSPTIS